MSKEALPVPLSPGIAVGLQCHELMRAYCWGGSALPHRAQRHDACHTTSLTLGALLQEPQQIAPKTVCPAVLHDQQVCAETRQP